MKIDVPNTTDVAAALKLSSKPLSGLAYLVVINLGLMLASPCVSAACQLSRWHLQSEGFLSHLQ